MTSNVSRRRLLPRPQRAGRAGLAAVWSALVVGERSIRSVHCARARHAAGVAEAVRRTLRHSRTRSVYRLGSKSRVDFPDGRTAALGATRIFDAAAQHEPLEPRVAIGAMVLENRHSPLSIRGNATSEVTTRALARQAVRTTSAVAPLRESTTKPCLRKSGFPVDCRLVVPNDGASGSPKVSGLRYCSLTGSSQTRIDVPRLSPPPLRRCLGLDEHVL